MTALDSKEMSDVMTSNDTETHKEAICGYLQQQYTWIFKTYVKTRWIILEGQILLCYKDIPRNDMEKENNFIELFNLKDYDVNIEENKEKHQFKLTSRHTTKYTMFIASSNDDISRWVNAIKAAQKSAIDEDIINLKISVVSDKLPSFSMILLNNTKWMNIIEKADKMMNEKCFPARYHIKSVDGGKRLTQGQYDHIESKHIITTLYEFQNTEHWKCLLFSPLYCDNKPEFSVQFDVCFIHQVRSNIISCKFMKNGEDPLQCPIYNTMKNHYTFTEENLNHLYEYTHFYDEYHHRNACKYGMECKAFVRLENGGNKLADRCHVKIYRHPPRNNRQIRMAERTAELILSDESKLNYVKRGYKLKDVKNSLNDLISEVIKNGYKNDLFISNFDEDMKTNDYSIMQIVENKLIHPRHKKLGSPLNKAQMLALILYTGCNCNYDLCKNQRAGDYDKWKVFDCFLYQAISLLSERETGSYKVYTGLSNVKLSKKSISKVYFPTYVSTSWVKEISLTFIGDEGMIIEIDESSRKRLKCCDVSWISKFSDECEILVARSTYEGSEKFWPSGKNWVEKSKVGIITKTENGFDMKIIDEQNGIQVVSLANATSDNQFLLVSSNGCIVM